MYEVLPLGSLQLHMYIYIAAGITSCKCLNIHACSSLSVLISCCQSSLQVPLSAWGSFHVYYNTGIDTLYIHSHLLMFHNDTYNGSIWGILSIAPPFVPVVDNYKSKTDSYQLQINFTKTTQIFTPTNLHIIYWKDDFSLSTSHSLRCILYLCPLSSCRQ